MVSRLAVLGLLLHGSQVFIVGFGFGETVSIEDKKRLEERQL